MFRETSRDYQPIQPFPPDLASESKAAAAKKHAGGSRTFASKLQTASAERWIVGIIIVFAGVLAWVHLQRASIWYDEAITLLTTSGHAKLQWSLGMGQFKPSLDFHRILRDLYEQDVHPPLYFWMLAVWRTCLGWSLEVARVFSLLCTLGTLWLLYRFARAEGMRWPWVPVCVYAASAVGTWYAYDARPYAMATLLVMVTQLLAEKRSRWTGVCGAAAFATHYFAALCVAPLLALHCWTRWRTQRWWSVLTAGTFVICAAPLALLLRIHVVARPHQYPRFGFFPKEIWALVRGAAQDTVPNTWLPGWGIAIGLGAFLVLAGVLRALKRKKSTVPFLYAGFLCGFLLLTIATNKSIAQMPVAYYLGIAAPWLALLVGYGINAYPRCGCAFGLALLIGLIASRPVVRTVNYREMVSRMKAECSDCPILVGTGYAGAVPASVLYEARGMPVYLLQPEDRVQQVAEHVGGRGTIFFVPSNEPPTAKVEEEFLQDYLAERKNGYFEVSLDRLPVIERAASEMAQPPVEEGEPFR